MLGTILYPERWLMLFLFSFVSFCNSLLFASFPPISILAAEYYEVDVVVINFLSLLYFIVYVPFCFVAAWMLDTKGLKITVHIINRQILTFRLHGVRHFKQSALGSVSVFPFHKLLASILFTSVTLSVPLLEYHNLHFHH